MATRLKPRPVHVDAAELRDAHPDFYRNVEGTMLRPLWEVMNTFASRTEPGPGMQPALWRYGDVRPLGMQSADIIAAEEAERRVLALMNPGLAPHMAITPTIYAGYQLVMPGEVAPSHRHSPAAFRFILEGGGAYTAVNGERTYMYPGDFVVTPSRTWHDHGNETDEPMIWLDGLDWPLTDKLGLTYFEAYPGFQHPETRPPGDSAQRYGMGIAPLEHGHEANHTPIVNYTFERTREALAAISHSTGPDPCHGVKTRYTNPLTGDDAIPTLSAFLQHLPAGFIGAPYRQTDACVYSVVEGSGRTEIGDIVLEWGPKDTFAVPIWARHRHIAGDDDVVLFSFSDRGLQEKLGLWREQQPER
ncbi:MAG: gentisate 1,2-dioxygenase [Proteobacteria bacterium]|nr:gentisate 1,2-dioxygenase [Pseudomonadota bacterium]